MPVLEPRQPLVHSPALCLSLLLNWQSNEFISRKRLNTHISPARVPVIQPQNHTTSARKHYGIITRAGDGLSAEAMLPQYCSYTTILQYNDSELRLFL